MKKLINYTPSRTSKVFFGLLPFVLLIILYIAGSDARLEINPSDKLLPAFSQMGESMHRMAFEPSKRTGEYLFWQDTVMFFCFHI
jgi:NitT/TauT family transport system permease protein